MQTKLVYSSNNLNINESIKLFKRNKWRCITFRIRVWMAVQRILAFSACSTFQYCPRTYIKIKFSQNTFSTSHCPLEQSKHHCGSSRKGPFPSYFGTSLFSPCLCSSCEQKGKKTTPPPLRLAPNSRVWLELGFLGTGIGCFHCPNILVACKRLYLQLEV